MHKPKDLSKLSLILGLSGVVLEALSLKIGRQRVAKQQEVIGSATLPHNLVNMLIARKIAQGLAGTRFGRWAMAEEVDLGVFRAKPSARFYLGLCLMALSYLLGLPAMVLCGYLAHAWKEPLILPLGVGAVFVAVHLIFAAGVYLAGANYAMVLLRWFASRFLRTHLSHSKRQ